MLNLIKEELIAIRDAYGDERRTEIVEVAPEIRVEDLIAEEDMVVTITHTGYIKRNPISLYRSQHRGGKGKMGMNVKEEDFVEDLFIASTHDYMLFFTDAGKIHWMKVHELPQAGRLTRGKAIVNLLNLSPEEKVTTILSLKEFSKGKYITFMTRRGIIKKTALEAYSNPRAGGIIAIHLEEGDELIAAKLTDGQLNLFIGTKLGKAIVNLLNLSPEEKVTTILSLKEFSKGKYITFMTRRGIIKKTALEAYSNPRAGGIIAIHLEEGDELIAARLTDGQLNLFIGTKLGKAIHFPEGQVRDMGRTARGIRGIRLIKGDEVVGMEMVVPHTQILTVTSRGYGKRTAASEYRTQNRGGTGIFTVKRTQKTGDVVGIKTVVDEDELMLISDRGKIIRLHAVDIPVQGRSTQGVRLITVEEGERVVAIAKLAEKE